MSDEVKVRFNQSTQDVPYTKEVNGDVGFLNHMIRYGSPGALSGITEGDQIQVVKAIEAFFN